MSNSFGTNNVVVKSAFAFADTKSLEVPRSIYNVVLRGHQKFGAIYG